ncbi:hypothetical protein LTR10_018152 [Elasticomyces elasticus]|uniref:Uncharacterized protein n=1 Tax=Exophiala sideris TaxID=1016849 RepID=A0ABR0J2R0_9EURO|nr:hypothetical protein LTR10_018152 [Elasticomyces elasticus]KAK5024967.1 hypothetical protein LTS07_008345 [Exophiala sideris]KAK5031443.1 hypothetical protein LTR13_007771 [Exophiala sideris]KAK5055005.1 hypothetical protein LTR69_008573 [Exophiala sideris]KAK5179886.1 hypothetical protein LTR44_007702 [Eurotiomycetes sp. CCFEE 6388]
MSFTGLKRLLDQKHNPPAPATESFAGRVVLVTGATGGLGMEAAKKIALLGPDKLIITARNEAKGQTAKREIEASVKSVPSRGGSKGIEIIPMVLDMSSFAGVQQFVDTLQAQFPNIDAALLNAGSMPSKYVQSKDGWEEALQVNALSTFLLGVLLLPLLKAAADVGKPYKPHLTFVSSGTAWIIKPEKLGQLIDSETPLEDLNDPKNFPSTLVGAQNQYARSKLVLEYAVRHLAVTPSLRHDNGEVKVIVNTVCPGMCKSDLGRQVTTNFLVKLLSWIVFTFFARSASDGVNAFTMALTLGDESHGEMWKNDRVFETGPMNTTGEGRKFGDKIWDEFRQVILKADATTKPFLS